MRIVPCLVWIAAASGCGGTQKLVCPNGEDPVDGECDPEVYCGEGTVLDEDGLCVPEDPGGGGAECGDGTELVDGECVPNDEVCADGTTFDEAAGECVPDEGACAAGTTFNPDTFECDPACEPNEVYDPDLGECRPAPACGPGTAPDPQSGNCIPGPMAELTLATICVRRAIAVCGGIFDPACDCEHAGDFNGGGFRGKGGGGVGFPRDPAACIATESAFCEQVGVALARALVDEGEAEVSQAGLEAFDAYYRLDPGDCTRPVEWEVWSLELFLGIIEGQVAEGDECRSTISCAADRFCSFDEVGVGNCIDRARAGEACQFNWGQIDQRDSCAAGLRCIEQDFAGVCGEGLGSNCWMPSECGEGLTCRRLDEKANFTCQVPLGQRSTCFSFDHSDGCGTDLFCDDPQQDGTGSCQSAHGDGGSCPYCTEIEDYSDPSVPSPHSQCDDDLRCVPSDGEQVCSAEVSICPHTAEEIWGQDGICSEVGIE